MPITMKFPVCIVTLYLLFYLIVHVWSSTFRTRQVLGIKSHALSEYSGGFITTAKAAKIHRVIVHPEVYGLCILMAIRSFMPVSIGYVRIDHVAGFKYESIPITTA